MPGPQTCGTINEEEELEKPSHIQSPCFGVGNWMGQPYQARNWFDTSWRFFNFRFFPSLTSLFYASKNLQVKEETDRQTRFGSLMLWIVCSRKKTGSEILAPSQWLLASSLIFGLICFHWLGRGLHNAHFAEPIACESCPSINSTGEFNERVGFLRPFQGMDACETRGRSRLPERISESC